MNSRTLLALSSLVLIWAALFAMTWAHWGDLTTDCGREMYVPSQLAQGRTLYTDVWYPYTPGAPFVNSTLFRLFGFHLNVLYWAGALASLGSAILLFLTGLHLISRFAAWTTGAVLLIQSFVPGIFSFPLPYSYGAVYGCLSACFCLWLMVNACSSLRAGWMLAAGLASSMALLAKQEIGAGCFAALALLVVVRGLKQRSFQRVAMDVASLLPGCLLSIAVVYWMISLRGAEFLTQENLMSWPTSYFMKTYGALWLSFTGLVLTWHAFFRSVAALLIMAIFWFVFRWIVARYRGHWWLFWAALLVFTALPILGSHWGPPARLARWAFFPSAAPLLIIVMLPIVVWLFWRKAPETRLMQMLLLFCLAACVSVRILFRMAPYEYAIYYDGPVVLAFFVFLSWLLQRKIPGMQPSDRELAVLPYLATLITVIVGVLPLYIRDVGKAPLYTDRGVIYTEPKKAVTYRSVLDFIQRHAAPDVSFLSIPEDMSLYFFAGIQCPTRVMQFAPGVLAPGKMVAETIGQIEGKKVRYLIWSNRSYQEYGVPRFGVDFDRPLAKYLTITYRPIGSIGDQADGEWKAVVWERISGR